MDETVGGPRDFLANERTHLAWVRTALSVMVLGVAVARFGAGGSVSAAGVTAGAVLVLTAIAVLLYGSLRYRTTARELARGEYDAVHATRGPVLAGAALVIAVVVAAVLVIGAGA